MKTYDELGIKHQTAIDLKLEGFKYKEIATRVRVKEQTVAEWFQTKGLCYSAFQQKKQALAEERAIRFKEIDEQLRDLACEAIPAIRENLAKNNLKAALGVLDRTGFQPIRQVQEASEPKEVVVTYIYPEDKATKMEIVPEP